MRDVLAKMRECGKDVKMRDFPHDSGVARGGGHGPPQTFGECFFSPINLRRYVLLVCK